MTDTVVLSLCGAFLGICGVVIAALITSKVKNGNGSDSSQNGLVRVSTCDAKHGGLNKSLDSLWSEVRVLDNKMDKLMLHFKIGTSI